MKGSSRGWSQVLPVVHDRGVGENGHRLKPEVQTGFKEKLFPHEDSRTGCLGRFCDLHLWRFSGCTGDCWKQEAEPAGSRRLKPVLLRPGLDGRRQGISALCTVLRADTPELKKLMENYKEFRIKKKKSQKFV